MEAQPVYPSTTSVRELPAADAKTTGRVSAPMDRACGVSRVDRLVASCPEDDLSTAGQNAQVELEARTDETAASPWDALGRARTARVAELLTSLVEPILAIELVPARNPIGMPLPAIVLKGVPST